MTETNRYFAQTVEGMQLSPRSRLRRWHDTNVGEMYIFFELLILMPFCKKHSIQAYWSRDALISTPTFAKFMSRDGFLLLLSFMHFADNTQPGTDRLWKISHVFSDLRRKFKEVFVLFQKMVVDESLIFFLGRLGFRQYIPR